MKNKRLAIIVIAIAILLLLPLVAMQFTKEVNWTLFDFVIMAALLIGTGLIGELILRKAKNRKSRLVLCSAILFAFFLIWAELAVGLFGTPFAGS